MNNLTRLLDREQKWYKLGPFVVGRGIPKKLPLYYFFLLGMSFFMSLIPLTPFWLIAKMSSGWVFLFVVFPFLGSLLLQGIKQAGKSPERYIGSMIWFACSHKQINPYRPIDTSVIYQFGTTYTIGGQE